MPYFPVEQQAKEYQGPATNQIRVVNAPPSHIGLPRDADSGSTILAKPSDTMKTDLGSLSKVASASCGVMKYAAKKGGKSGGKKGAATVPIDLPFMIKKKGKQLRLGVDASPQYTAMRHSGDPGALRMYQAALAQHRPESQVELIDNLKRQGISVSRSTRTKAKIGDVLQNPLAGMILPYAGSFIPAGKDSEGNPRTLDDVIGLPGQLALMAAPSLYHGPLSYKNGVITGAKFKPKKKYKETLKSYKKMRSANPVLALVRQQKAANKAQRPANVAEAPANKAQAPKAQAPADIAETLAKPARRVFAKRDIATAGSVYRAAYYEGREDGLSHAEAHKRAMSRASRHVGEAT